MKSLSRLGFTMQRVIAAKGFSGLFDVAWRRLLGVPVVSELRLVEYPFDTRHGVRTAGLVDVSVDSDQFEYYAVSPSVFREACRKWVATLDSAGDLERYTFVDLGCGLGRALLLASELPFREVLGVELSADLVRGARENIESWTTGGRSKAPIRVLQQDARSFRFPQAPILVFLFNPFGESTLLQILARLRTDCESGPGSVDVLYSYPKYGYVFDKKSLFKRLWMAAIPLDEEDSSADVFGNKKEVCAAYRLSRPAKNVLVG